MPRYTLPLDAIQPEVDGTAHVGGKAAGLAALIAAGFPVPEGFVITTDAYRDFIAAAELSGLPARQIHEQASHHAVPTDVSEQILAAYADMGSPSVAVRSSGTAEDLPDASFAGQHDSFLAIDDPDTLIDAVRDCWASLWTPRAAAYRDERGGQDERLALAVIVQRMVPARWAGVLLTADPVSGRRDHMVVEAVRGLGESLVSGTDTGEHVILDRTTGRRVRGRTSLPALDELARLGREVEESSGQPQDIEWALADDGFQLVQARPLTALPQAPAPERRSRRPHFTPDIGMAADHMPYPPFPLDVSLFVRPALQSVLAALDRAGFVVPDVEDVLIEIDEGVVQIHPPVQLRPSWRALLGVPRSVPAIVRLLRSSPRAWIARTDATLVQLARRIDAEDLEGLSNDELHARLDALLRELGLLFPLRFGTMSRGMLAAALLPRVLRALVGDERAPELADDLMAAVPSITTDANSALQRIAETVRTSPELLAVYRAEEPGVIARRLEDTAAGRTHLGAVDDYLGSFGFRELSMPTVGQPPLREATDVVHGLIKGLADRHRDPHEAAEDRPSKARRQLDDVQGLRARALLPVARSMIDTARTGAAFREDSHYRIMMTFAVMRRVALESGRRLVREGALDSPDDVAYLVRDELSGKPPRAVRRVVERRRAAREAAMPDYTIFPLERAGAAGKDLLQGTPASRGVAEGTVRLVRDESEFSRLREGEILVCPYTNPTWTPLFSLAAGVVVDSGGAASHAAIVARERGIPAVMDTRQGTRVLVDGQRVVVDGTAGTVTPADATS